MPNNDDYLSRQLSAVNNAFGIQAVDNNNQVQPNLIDGLDYKALYKVLESEAETINLYPNSPQYANAMCNRVKQKRSKIVQRQANR